MVYPGSSSLFWSSSNYNYDYIYPNSSSPSSSVDCTLSLAPPSTQNTTHPHNTTPMSSYNCRSSPTTTDTLLAGRRCANCDTTSTPLWRNGPRGPKSLCNACGIRFKKEERRAAAASTTVESGAHNSFSWGTPQKTQCYSGPNEFQFKDDVDRGTDSAGIQFFSWFTHDHRPTGLQVHEFTR